MSEITLVEWQRRFDILNCKVDKMLALIEAITPQPAPEKFLDVHSACKKLGISRQSLYRYIKAGKIRSLRLGGTVRIDWKSIEKLLDRTKNP